MEKARYRMIFDTGSQTGSLLASGKVYTLNKKFGDELIRKGKAVFYSKETAKRIVKLNGKEMTWGDYLKYLNKIKKEDKIYLKSLE